MEELPRCMINEYGLLGAVTVRNTTKLGVEQPQLLKRLRLSRILHPKEIQPIPEREEYPPMATDDPRDLYEEDWGPSERTNPDGMITKSPGKRSLRLPPLQTRRASPKEPTI